MLRRCTSFLAAGLLLAIATPASVAQSPASGGTLYTIQLRASESRALITGLRDSLAQHGLPVYMMHPAAEGRRQYRLRMGPFREQKDARRLADFLGLSDYGLTDVAGGQDAFTRVVSQVITDAVRLQPAPPYVYIGERHAFVLVRLPVSATALTPPRALLYVPGREEPLRLDHMTGFQESALALLFGQAERVFVNPNGRPVSAFSESIAAFSRAVGLSHDAIHNGLAFYDDSAAVRFTMLHAYDFVADTLVAYQAPGFDYVTADDERKRFTGLVTHRRRLRQGNAHAWRLMPHGGGKLATDRTALYVRPAERGDVMELGIVFFSRIKEKG